MDLLDFSLICRKRVRVSLCYPYLIYPNHGWAPQSAIQDTLTFTSVWLVFSYMNYFFVCVCLRQGWNFNIIINMLLIIVRIEYLHTLHYSVLLTIHRRGIFSPSRHVKKYTELHIISRTHGAQRSVSHQGPFLPNFTLLLINCTSSKNMGVLRFWESSVFQWARSLMHITHNLASLFDVVILICMLYWKHIVSSAPRGTFNKIENILTIQLKGFNSSQSLEEIIFTLHIW